MMFNGWWLLIVLPYMAAVGKRHYVWGYYVDHIIILGAPFNESTVATLRQSAQVLFEIPHKLDETIPVWFNKHARAAVLALDESVEKWQLFPNEAAGDETIFMDALSQIPLLKETKKEIDLAKSLQVARQLYRTWNATNSFNLIYLLIAGDDPISSEIEAGAKKVRDEEGAWLYVIHTSGQCKGCWKLTGSNFAERIMFAKDMVGEFQKVENNFNAYVCKKEIGYRYINEKQDACVKAKWTPMSGKREYYCGDAEPQLGLSPMEECKGICDKWWPMESECTCGKNVSRVSGRYRSEFLNTCDQPVDCGPCPPKPAALPGWIIGVIVVLAIGGVVGGLVCARVVVRRRRMKRAVMAVKKEPGGTTAVVGGRGTVVQEKEDFKYEFTFQGKSAMITIDEKSVFGKGKWPARKSAKSRLSEAMNAPRGKKSVKK